ncbi:MAG: 3-deoxy-D-manno-octulosonic acid kinase [Proteobacteria bacterium]|nr:3-deoxy-D-manno-octulosonic acid kinase [Pseudomonadota bacterium]
MRLERVATGTGAILYDPSRIDHPCAGDFDAAALQRAGRVVATATGRGSAWFLDATRTGAPVVLRHYRRGGFAARLASDRYLWLGEQATRAFRELRLLAALEEQGLPAARPVAAQYRRQGLGYRAELLTLAIPRARTLADRLAEPLPEALWRRVGATLRRFHDAGVRHADLNARNVLFDGDDQVQLIDFDRGRLASPGRWCAQNLERLRRSLAKLGGEALADPRSAAWSALLEGYGAPRSAPPR